MNQANQAFKAQKRVRGPWRRYLDALAPLRPDLHRYCCRLTGNVWDGEDLVQDTLIRVFSLLGKMDAQLQNPRAYLIRTATNLWIDRARKAAREQELVELAAQGEESVERDASLQPEVFDAATGLLQRLHPQERAAVVLNDVFDYSLAETAAILKTSVGAVKSALHRARSRIDEKLPAATLQTPSRQLVEAFMRARAAKELAALEKLCAADLSIEMVGGWESDSFEQSRSFFTHAHMEMPALGFGRKPRWELLEFEGEWLVVGYRTLHGHEAVNEVHRLIENDGTITRVRSYCFCPETLAVVAERLGQQVVRRPIPHRPPSLSDAPRLLLRHMLTRQS